MAYWLLKTEPETYSWGDLVRDKRTAWDGVRNFRVSRISDIEMNSTRIETPDYDIPPTFALRELLERGAESTSLAMIWDPIAVRLCFDAGLGALSLTGSAAIDAVAVGVDGLTKPGWLLADDLAEVLQSEPSDMLAFVHQLPAIPTDDPARDNRLAALAEIYPSDKKQYVQWARAWFY